MDNILGEISEYGGFTMASKEELIRRIGLYNPKINFKIEAYLKFYKIIAQRSIYKPLFDLEHAGKIIIEDNLDTIVIYEGAKYIDMLRSIFGYGSIYGRHFRLTPSDVPREDSKKLYMIYHVI